MTFYYGTNISTKENTRTRDNLAGAAEKRVEEEQRDRDQRAFDNRVRAEAQKHGFLGDPRREHIISLIFTYFGEDAPTAVQIAMCESTLNPKAVNYDDAKITGHPSWGLFQLNRLKFTDWDDPLINIIEAKKLFDRRGWQPWSCARKIKNQNIIWMM